MDNKVVILGTSHGVNTPGKCSPDKKFREYKFSREVINLLKPRLEAPGFTVFVDMPSDEVPRPGSTELSLRCRYINGICKKFGSQNCIYVSIHVNAAGSDDHDLLPDEIQALYVENLGIVQRMRELHLKLRSLSTEDNPARDCDRYPFLKELIDLDKKLHSNWETYDHFTGTDGAAVMENNAREESRKAVRMINLAKGRYAKKPSEELKAQILALDYAQRTNTIGSLRQTDVSRTITAPAVLAQSQTPTVIVQENNALRETLAQLNQRLNEPFVTINTVTGDMGIKQAQDDYQRLMNNKSPKNKRR